MTNPAEQTFDAGSVLLQSMDRMFSKLIDRLGGMTADEYLWEPAEAGWSVRPSGDGPATVDGAGIREIDPAPVTTIAWRIWHLTFNNELVHHGAEIALLRDLYGAMNR